MVCTDKATVYVYPLRLVKKRQQSVHEKDGKEADEASEPLSLSGNDSPGVAGRQNNVDGRQGNGRRKVEGHDV